MPKTKLLKNIFTVEANIADRKELEKYNIDTIVNAAKPTLMGSAQGVDGAVHMAIDIINGESGYFKRMICKKMGVNESENRILCQRGEAVLTEGYNLCDYVIHVVGAEYDGGRSRLSSCSSSAVQILESCYCNVVKLIREHPNIRNVAIPIISSGEYGFPFEEAFKIALASVYNAIEEWKLSDSEIFELSGLEKIYFFLYDTDQKMLEQKLQIARKILEEYNLVMVKEERIVFQTSARAHFRYCKEIVDYDETRGYFFLAKLIREFLMLLRVLFLPVMALKDLFGNKSWEKRRQFVEWYTIIKVFIPILFHLLSESNVMGECTVMTRWVFPGIIIYNMCDTVTYLLVLVIMSDIQRPSANVIRSMILLFVNYMEVSFGLSYLYFTYHVQMGQNISFREVIAFGMLGTYEGENILLTSDHVFTLVNNGIRFFFITLMFGYFADHMHQRKFRS